MNRVSKFFLSYKFILFFYVFYYLIISYFSNEFDSLHFYELLLKVNSGEVLYEDYNIWYGPHIVFFLNFLKLINLSNYSFYIFLGLAQNILLAYLILKINNFYYKDESISRSVFVLSLFCINPMINNFYWDYYSIIFLFSSFYFYLKNDYIKSSFFGSFIFFLKQTQGIFFIIFIIFLLFYNLIFKKKKFIKYIIFFLFFSLLQLILISIFYNIDDYYHNSISFIFGYSESLFGGYFQTIKLVILKSLFFKIDQIFIFSSDFLKHKTLILFYIFFIFGFHLYLINFLFNLKSETFKEKFLYFVFVFLISCVMTSLIGRGYLAKIYIIFIFTLEIMYSKKHFYEKYFNKMIFCYTLFVIIFISSISLKNINNDFIRYEHNKFLSIPEAFFDNKDMYENTRDLQKYIHKKDLENIFVFGNSSRLPVLLNNTSTLNYNLYFYTSWQPMLIKKFQEQLAIQLNLKQPNFLIFSNNEEKIFIKDNKYIEKELEFYKNIYKNKIFSVLERIK